MGTPEFAVPSLRILIDNHFPIAAVVTAPDKPRGRGQELAPTPVKEMALEHHVPVLQPDSLKDGSFADDIRRLSPDLIVVVAFRILPPAVFTIPRLGSFNLHASLLPRYRGAAPINWAIINGETETGVTTFLLQEKVDRGGILLQARIPVADDDNAGTVHDKLAEVGAEVVLHTVRLLEQGRAVPRVQDDAQASQAPKIFKDDCRIRWNQPADRIHNFVRGLSPYPAAFSLHSSRVVKIFRTIVLPAPSAGPPGSVVATSTTLDVNTTSTLLRILEIQQEGRRRMSVEEFLRGYAVTNGDLLE